jgi:hypothetical protein
MQIVHVASRPKFHVLSNGALVFGVTLISCTGKWINLFTETVLVFNLHFQHTGLHLQENQVHHSQFERSVKFWAINYINILHLLCICEGRNDSFLPLKDVGIHTSRYAYMHAANTKEP